MDKIERAYNLIDEVEYSKAKKIGEELISEGNLEGYFILTDIAEETEDLQVCLEILKGGIEEHKNWKLWMRLGNYESDLELFEDAEYSMDRALYMTDADQSLVKLNKAILLRRLKRFEESMKIIRECWEDYPVKSFCLELDILNELEQYKTITSKIDQNLLEDGYEHDYDSFSSAYFISQTLIIN